MGKTANYGLPKWEKSDFIKMDDFNAAFGKIDETLKANADAAAAKAEAETVTAIAQTIASSKICRAKFGTYHRHRSIGPKSPEQRRMRLLPRGAGAVPRGRRTENDGHTRRDRLLVRHHRQYPVLLRLCLHKVSGRRRNKYLHEAGICKAL